MEEQFLTSIDKKLDAIVRLLANRTIEGAKNKTEAIVKLGGLGLDPNLIAEIVDTTTPTVSARLSEVRRKGKEQTKKVKKVESNE